MRTSWEQSEAQISWLEQKQTNISLLGRHDIKTQNKTIELLRQNNLNIITEYLYSEKAKKYYYHKVILTLKIEILTLGSNWTKNKEHWAPIGEACAQVATALGCTGWNETLSTCHDKHFMRFLSEKHPDASENSHLIFSFINHS